MNWFVKYSALQAKISLKWLPHITDIDENVFNVLNLTKQVFLRVSFLQENH